MILINVNGAPHNIPNEQPLPDTLEYLGFAGSHFAVAIDGEFVPRGQWQNVTLKGGEALEVLSPKQGG